MKKMVLAICFVVLSFLIFAAGFYFGNHYDFTMTQHVSG